MQDFARRTFVLKRTAVAHPTIVNINVERNAAFLKFCQILHVRFFDAKLVFVFLCQFCVAHFTTMPITNCVRWWLVFRLKFVACRAKPA